MSWSTCVGLLLGALFVWACRLAMIVANHEEKALVDDILSGGDWVTGLAIGVGAVVVLPLATAILRPLAKTAIKGGILAYQGAAELIENIGDLSPKLSPKPAGEQRTGAGRANAGHRDWPGTAQWKESKEFGG